MTLSAVVVFGGSVACTPIAAGAAARRIMCLAGSSSPRVPCAIRIRRNLSASSADSYFNALFFGIPMLKSPQPMALKPSKNISRFYSLHDVGGQRTRDENGPNASDQIISAKRCSVLMSIIGGHNRVLSDI
jgi:hypothetical protein